MGDPVANCSYCGALYHRSELRRDRSGFLACEMDYGNDLTTLDVANAAGASRTKKRRTVGDAGAMDTFAAGQPQYLMVPNSASVVDPHTLQLMPLAGVVAYLDLQWTLMQARGLVKFQAVP